MRVDMIGQRYGRYTVVGLSPQKNKVHCVCDCGEERDVDTGSLKRGDTKSCGCYRRDRMTVHGKYHTKLYNVWYGMKQRCEYDRHIDNEWYMARGITMCKEWENSFESFYEWAISSWYDDGLSIDRIDNSLGYFPENCRFVTAKDQANNRRTNLLFEHGGVTRTLKQWTEMLGLKYTTVYYRIKHGVPFEQAIT